MVWTSSGESNKNDAPLFRSHNARQLWLVPARHHDKADQLSIEKSHDETSPDRTAADCGHMPRPWPLIDQSLR
jgi:hypothetical protein